MCTPLELLDTTELFPRNSLKLADRWQLRFHLETPPQDFWVSIDTELSIFC